MLEEQLATREEMIAFLKAKQQPQADQPSQQLGQSPSREQMIQFLKEKQNITSPQQAQPSQEQITLSGQINKGLKEVPEAIGSTIGLQMAGPLGSGVGAAIGKSASELASGVQSLIDNPQAFLADLSRLPTKEQVISKLNDYFNTVSLNTAVPAIVNKVAGGAMVAPSALKQEAEQLAEKATGATAVQAQKFKPGAGRELLDRGIVKAGEVPADVAKRSQDLIKKSENQIDSALTALDEKGIKVNVSDILTDIQTKATELAKDPSQSSIVKKLNSIADDIVNTGESFVSPGAAEKTKRGFNQIAKNWLDPEQGQAGKIAYRAYRDAVEKTATKEAPEIAKVFKEAKQTFGLMAPIEEAAARRAQQLKQSPLGGFLDVVAAGGTGAAVGGIEGLATGVAAAAARRAIAPRLASTGAVSLDAVSKALSGVPQYAKLAQDNPQIFTTLANNVYNTFKGTYKEPSKMTESGARALQNAGFDPVIIEQLQARPDGKKILEDASGVSPDSRAMEAIKKKIESLKLPRQKSSSAYPLIMRKDGLQATVFNDRDYKEAKSEGWA